jgi:hypothetical protein
MPEEFYPWDRSPDTLIPRTGKLYRLFCWVFGHTWRKWYWGGVEGPFDADVCFICHKMRGPLALDRTTPDFPSMWLP